MLSRLVTLPLYHVNASQPKKFCRIIVHIGIRPTVMFTDVAENWSKITSGTDVYWGDF